MVKQRLITEQEYEKIGCLARHLVPKKIIAEVIGYSEAGFYKRLKRDATLRLALEGNYDEGAIGLYVSQYRQAIDHHYTICKKCHKIADGEWYESCPFCDKEDPENAGRHTHVRHKFVEADTAMLIHMGKHHLGQTDRALLKVKDDGGEDHPYKNLSEAEIDKKLAALAVLLNEEYGPKPGNDDLPVADYT